MSNHWRDAAPGLTNHGRWGPDDQVGTLNHVGPEQIRAAAAEVRTGELFPLGAPLDGRLPQGRSGIRRNPQHVMLADGRPSELDRGDRGDFRFAEDLLILPQQAGTQWDALAHAWYDDALYNGHPADTVTSLGATRCGIEHAARRGMAGRGVLLDVARHQGVDHLAPRTGITPDDLDAVAAAQRVTVRTGDYVVVRTGWWGKYTADRDNRSFLREYAGLTWECARWAADHEIAAIAADNFSVEVAGDGSYPFHLLALRELGLFLGELWALDALAAACAADRRYTFLLTAQPLDVPGGVASTVNPLAIR